MFLGPRVLCSFVPGSGLPVANAHLALVQSTPNGSYESPRAEHEFWPAGFPHFYFLIYSMNTYPINLKKVAYENYLLGLSVTNKSII